ncbi:GDP-mannose mannosyl hydrolase [Marinobacterium marinum]|uniref:GDP-mannose mannosyl hydrolase n=1 Tax=Marinobacterium marinum TaxID=2756129 RepID=A0A7W2AAY2_9GAMM|nr:GDP-mannose mannosyl hydrolase [Marinobacterium marinum]MBA4501510.1 GDP-mannose mannosyl hydrolase [Marinobacterium marinum]
MWIDNDTFKTIVDTTPLVSIDLVVENANGEILLGQRTNRPAQGYWFVPGGRVLKDESLDAAFRRLTQAELGQVFERSQARLLGVYEHFYSDSVFGKGEGNPSTHYVVLGYHLKLDADMVLTPPKQQHSAYSWWSPKVMRDDPQVHENSRAYLAAL